MANEEKKTFKISQLTKIENIDDEDLFLVSDYENGACYTKKMTTKQLMEFITKNNTISQEIKNPDSPIGEAIDNKIEQAASDEGVLKPTITKTVEKTVNTMIFDAGGAQEK